MSFFLFDEGSIFQLGVYFPYPQEEGRGLLEISALFHFESKEFPYVSNTNRS
jgi:hypothetical protein